MVRRFNDLIVAYQLVGILLQLSVDTQVRTLGLGGTKRRGLSPPSVTRVRFLEGGVHIPPGFSKGGCQFPSQLK